MQTIMNYKNEIKNIITESRNQDSQLHEAGLENTFRFFESINIYFEEDNELQALSDLYNECKLEVIEEEINAIKTFLKINAK